MQWFFLSLLTAIFQSLGAVLSKHSAEKVDVISAAWSQQFFALFIYVPLVFLTNSFQPVNHIFWIATSVNALLATFSILLYFKALKNSPISVTIPVLALTPAFMLLTSPIIVGEFPNMHGVVGILIIVIGSYILNLSKRIHSPFEPLLCIVKKRGSRYMLIVAFLWSIGGSIDKVAVLNSNPYLYLFVSSSMMVCFFTIIIIIRGVSLRNIFRHYPEFVSLGILESLTGVTQMWALTMTIVPNVIAVKRTSILFNVVWGKVFFKEENIKERFIGAAIMVVGVVIIVLS